MTRMKLLMGATALVAAATAISGAASAQTVTVNGGGSSLIAPYLNQIEDCYGTDVPLLKNGKASQTIALFDYTGSPAHNCASGPIDSTLTLNYVSANSGAGIAGFFTNDGNDLLLAGPGTGAGTFLNYGTTPTSLPNIQYAASDAGLDGSDIAVYLNGSGTAAGVGATIQGTAQTWSIEAPGNASTGTTMGVADYVNPVAFYGAPIEVPLLVAPVTLAYSPVYEYAVNTTGAHSYKFNVHKPNKDGSGGLVLDMNTVCAIFNGQITNWNDPALKYLNGNVALVDPTDPAATNGQWTSVGLPIEIVGRSDSSGTTSIFYRALAAQCSGSDTDGGDTISYTNAYTGGALFVPAALTGPTASISSSGVVSYTNGTPTPGKFTVLKGSGGIAQYLALNQGSPLPTANGTVIKAGQLGYIGPDYVLPAVAVTAANTYGLNVVDIKVGTTAVEPTPANALKAFGTGATALVPPQSGPTGLYVAGNLGTGKRSAPQDWVEPITQTTTLSTGTVIPTPLSNPNVNVPGVTAAYPIVGTTDGFFYTCYNSATVVTKIKAFLNYYETNNLVIKPDVAPATNGGLLEINGFPPLPKAWLTAINQTFFNPTTTGTAATKPLGLYIAQAGSTSDTQCTAANPGA